MAITAATRTNIIELVVTAYNQAPGTTLLTELVAIVDGGGTLADVATHLTTSDTWSATYPAFQTAEEFATEWLGNLVPEASAEALAGGVDIAVGLINGGASFADIILVAQDFLSNLEESDATFGTSAANFSNKVEVATYYTITLEEAAASTSTLSGVTSDDSTVTAAKAAADTAALPAADAGASYTLLTGLDSKTMGSGDDSAFAVDSTTAASDTFNVSDAVDGSTGTDTFYLTVDSITGATTYTPSRIDNFEKFSVTNVDATPDAVTINANLLGINSVEVSASTADVNFTNITAGSAISLIGNTAAVDIQHKNAGLTGSADSVTVSMVGNTGNVTIDSDGAQDIESATLSVEGVNTGNYTIGDSSASTVTSVTVTGTGSIDLEAGGDLNTALETLDASANSGGVTFTSSIATGTTLTGGSGNDVLTGASGNDVLTGGVGNDTLTLTAGKDNISGGDGDDVVVANGADKDDSIAGGDGTDTLSINAALSYDDESTPTVNDAANISGFETLRTEASITQDMAALSGIVAVEGESGVLTATEAGAIADFYALDDNVGLDITMATASNTTANNLNIHVGEATAQTNSTGVTVDAIQYETALIDSKGADSNTVTDFEADALTKLTVTGNKSISVTLNDSTAVSTLPLTTVDASAFTGSSLTVSAVEADSGVTITTGSSALIATVGDGANSVTGTSGDDNITTGSGADTISTNDGEDTISAGDGANTITVGDGNATITGGEGVDTVTAGAGNNTITLGDGADVLTVGAGNNTITNAAGNATITANDGENTVTNTAGNSTITLGDGGNTVNLTAGNSTVVTGALADTVTITAGNNNVTSGAGNDTITLGSGNDTVDAGTGTDSVAFSISSGTWTGSISDAETITATFGGSATVDFDGISDYDTIAVTASATSTTATVKNIGSATINLSDDAVETGGDGDIVDLTIDTTADADIDLDIGANQEAATAAAADLESLTITDAKSLDITTSGGSLSNVLDHDLEAVALDDDETTSVSITAGAYTSIETGHLTETDSLESVTATSNSEADITIENIVDGSNLSSLTLTASGLNSTISISEVGSTDAAILDTITMAASNGSTITMAADIVTAENISSISQTASGTGSTVNPHQISADGLTVTSQTISATDGGSIDVESNAATLNYLPKSMTISTSGTGSTVDADTYVYDAGALAVTESSISIDASGASSVINAEVFTAGGAEVDLININVGSYATLNIAGDGEDEGDTNESDVTSTIVATSDIGTMTLNVDDYGTFNTLEASEGTEAAVAALADTLYVTGTYVGTLNITVDDNATWYADAVDYTLSTDVEAAIGVETLNITLGDQENETDVLLNATEGLIDIGGVDYIVLEDAEGDAGTYYQGSITLLGDEDNAISIGAQALAASAKQANAGGASTYGSWTLTTYGGADAITGGEGIDTINSGAGNDTIDGADGNDIITAGNGADSITVGTGGDSVNLTETVSAADVVVVADNGHGSAVGSEEGTFTAFNVITGFNTLVDHIDHNDGSFAGAALTFVVANTLGTNDLGAAEYNDVDAVLAFLNDAAVEDTIAADSADYAANEDILVAVTLGNGTTAVYEIYDATAGTLVVGDIALVATVDATMVAGDFM